MTTLSPGDKAPAFSLTDDTGATVRVERAIAEVFAA